MLGLSLYSRLQKLTKEAFLTFDSVPVDLKASHEIVKKSKSQFERIDKLYKLIKNYDLEIIKQKVSGTDNITFTVRFNDLISCNVYVKQFQHFFEKEAGYKPESDLDLLAMIRDNLKGSYEFYKENLDKFYSLLKRKKVIAENVTQKKKKVSTSNTKKRR